MTLPPRLEARLREVLSEECASTLARDIVNVLAFKGDPRAGRNLAVSIDQIQDILNEHDGPPSDRDIKEAVSQLVVIHRLPIGSARQEPFGYFLIVSDDDAEQAVRPLMGELKSLATRISAISPKTDYIRELQGQARLCEEQPCAHVETRYELGNTFCVFCGIWLHAGLNCLEAQR